MENGTARKTTQALSANNLLTEQAAFVKLPTVTKITDPKPYLLLAYSVRATVNHWFQEDKELRYARAGLPLAERDMSKERQEDENINLKRAGRIEKIIKEHVAPDTHKTF